jgi:tripartite-type tricarboxylate transporter receptor subunit TctC
MLSRRYLFLLLSGLTLSVSALAQSYPSKPVTLMVPYPPGGLSDVVARKVNTVLAKALGQPVVIENLGGAGGAIAAQKVLNAPSDGYYIFQGSPNELILAPLANAAVKYKAEDFRQIQRVAVSPIAVTARKDLPASNADELAAYAARMVKEGKPMTYASVGTGSFYHLLGEQMAKAIGSAMLHVPYKGGGPILTDMLGGQIDIFITPYGAPHVEMDKVSKIKFVTALSAERQALIKHVPSVDESKALKGFHYNIGTGYFVKKDTPESVVQVLHKALNEVLADPELRAALQAQGGEVASPMTLEAAAKAYADEMAQYRAIAKSINLQPQ